MKKSAHDKNQFKEKQFNKSEGTGSPSKSVDLSSQNAVSRLFRNSRGSDCGGWLMRVYLVIRIGREVLVINMAQNAVLQLPLIVAAFSLRLLSLNDIIW